MNTQCKCFPANPATNIYYRPQAQQYQQAVPVAPIKPQEQAPTGWRDVPFAVLFCKYPLGFYRYSNTP